MRGVMAGLFTVSVLVVFSSVGCSQGGRRHKELFQITTTTLPEGEVGVPYSATTLTATGGTPPYTWSDVNLSLIHI